MPLTLNPNVPISGLDFTCGGACATAGGGGTAFVCMLAQAAMTTAADLATSIRSFMRPINSGCHRASAPREPTLSARARTGPLDAFDLRPLTALQRDARMPTSETASGASRADCYRYTDF